MTDTTPPRARTGRPRGKKDTAPRQGHTGRVKGSKNRTRKPPTDTLHIRLTLEALNRATVAAYVANVSRDEWVRNVVYAALGMDTKKD